MKDNQDKYPQLRFKGFTDPWEERKFGELYKKVTEKNDLSFGKDKIISVANMYFKTDESRSDDAYMRTYNIFRVGDIAFEGHSSKQFAYGRFVENTIGDGIVSHIFDVFRPISNYDLQYWKYAIINEQIMGRILMTSTTQSTMMNNLVSKDFLKRQLAVPNYEEQAKIGAFLESLDKLIAANQRKVDLLKEQKKGYLQKMFPKNGAKVPELRFAGFADAWEQRKLGDAVSISSGVTGDAKLQDGKYRLTRIESISQGMLNIARLGFTNEKPDQKYLLNLGDILYSNINSLSHIGKVALVDTAGIYHGINLLRFQMRNDVDSEFLFQRLNTMPMKSWAVSHANPAVSQASINQTELSKQPISSPTITEQQKIGSFFKQLDDTIALHQRKLDLLKKQKKGFLQKMFV